MKKCIVSGGVYPLGGVVDGVDQLNDHNSPQNYIEGGVEVDVLEERVAEVTTYGGFHSGHSMKVLAVHGRCGFYTASAFA